MKSKTYTWKTILKYVLFAPFSLIVIPLSVLILIIECGEATEDIFKELMK